MRKLGNNSTGGAIRLGMHNNTSIVIDETVYSDGPSDYTVFQVDSIRPLRLGKALISDIDESELKRFLSVDVG